jgi:ABC-type dipeptide/oligopeptide/nickel transport system permease component
MQKLPATLELAFVAMVLAIALGIPLGLVAGLRPHSFVGRAIMAGSILGFSLPPSGSGWCSSWCSRCTWDGCRPMGAARR